MAESGLTSRQGQAENAGIFRGLEPGLGSRSGMLRLAGRLVLHNVAGNCAGRHRQRTRQVHKPWAAASGEVPVLRADNHLVGTRGYTWTCVYACAATGFDDMRSRLLKDFQIALAHAVLACLLRAELNI